MSSGNKNLKVITLKCLAVTLLLSGITLLLAQQSQAFSSPQEYPALDKGVNPVADGPVRAEILSSNPEAESYLAYNPFTMDEIRSTVATPDSTVSGEDESLLSGPSILTWIIRRPIRVPVRPPLLSPYVPLP